MEDYNTPIKTYIQDGLEYQGLSGITQKIRYYLQENDSERQDDYLAVLSEPKQEKFIRLADSNILLTNGESTVIELSFLKNNQKQTVERSVFTFLDLLGVLGGVYGIFCIFGGYFVAVFADRLLNYSILSHLYHIDTIECQKDHNNEFNDMNRIDQVLNASTDRIDEHKSA